MFIPSQRCRLFVLPPGPMWEPDGHALGAAPAPCAYLFTQFKHLFQEQGTAGQPPTYSPHADLRLPWQRSTLVTITWGVGGGGLQSRKGHRPRNPIFRGTSQSHRHLYFRRTWYFVCLLVLSASTTLEETTLFYQ